MESTQKEYKEMSQIKFYQSLVDALRHPDQNSIRMSMKDVHAKGLFSLVIKGTEPGELTRAFIAHKKLPAFKVQYHTHRYHLKLTVIKGTVMHHEASIVASSVGTVQLSKYTYKSPLNGGSGLSYEKEVYVTPKDYIIPVGGSVYLDTEDYHTVSCCKGSIWIVEEIGFEKDHSEVLGVPFVLDGLYKDPSMFQINDNIQILLLELVKIMQAYKLNLQQ